MTTAAIEPLLNRVGKRVFVHYYEQFRDVQLPAAEVVALLPGTYILKSRWSRTTKARRIFREGLEAGALAIMAAADRVEPETAERAREPPRPPDERPVVARRCDP